MGEHLQGTDHGDPLPSWLPQAAERYLLHTETGRSIRSLARSGGCHASTVLRQIRRFENRRDDPLIDEALRKLGERHFANISSIRQGTAVTMGKPMRKSAIDPEETRLNSEACRVLRRLNESGAILAVGSGMDKAAVVRALPGGKTTRTAVVDQGVAQVMALKDWISCKRPGKIAQYEISTAGRSALKRLLEEAEKQPRDLTDSTEIFAGQHRIWDEKEVNATNGMRQKIRYNLAESPLATLARRKDKHGNRFLDDDLVAAGERLREDFELAQMAPRVSQNWDKFLTGGDRGGYAPSGPSTGPAEARERVSAALRDLGPGLGDVVLRCCCFLEGMETAEKRMGWSARSGKIVLRIALQRLNRHYEESSGAGGRMIG